MSRRQIRIIDGHLATACERLSEVLASVAVESSVSAERLRDAMHDHATAILASVWSARWELIGHDDPDDPLDPTDPQKMDVSRWSEPDPDRWIAPNLTPGGATGKTSKTVSEADDAED